MGNNNCLTELRWVNKVQKHESSPRKHHDQTGRERRQCRARSQTGRDREINQYKQQEIRTRSFNTFSLPTVRYNLNIKCHKKMEMLKLSLLDGWLGYIRYLTRKLGPCLFLWCGCSICFWLLLFCPFCPFMSARLGTAGPTKINNTRVQSSDSRQGGRSTIRRTIALESVVEGTWPCQCLAILGQSLCHSSVCKRTIYTNLDVDGTKWAECMRKVLALDSEDSVSVHHCYF